MNSVETKVNQSAPPIVVRDLTFAYAVQPVLREIDFSLQQCSVGLLGPNGSGKTTLLRALMGHLRLPRAKVEVLGNDMAAAPRKARGHLGWMPERGGIIPGMHGVALVSYLGELGGMPARDAMQRAHEVLDYVGLGEARYRNCEDYSQGMRQRLKLAQALVHDPDWLLLDEPTSGLDPRGRIAILDLVRDLAFNKGFGVILSTHLLADVEAVCREILVLRQGRLLAHQRVDPDDASTRPTFEVEGFGDEEAFYGRLRDSGAEVNCEGRLALVTPAEGEGATVILAAAHASGYGLRRLHRQTITLEDMFYKLVEE